MATVDRRGLFKSILGSSRANITAGLEPLATPLNKKQAIHLLRRIGFGVDLKTLNFILGKTPNEAVNWILNNGVAKSNPTPPAWHNMEFLDPNLQTPAKQGEVRAFNTEQFIKNNEDLTLWWIRQMQNDRDSPLEKMSLFWHGHFTSSYLICNNIAGQLMYKQNALFRKFHLGDFKNFVQNMTLDGAMMLYLNGNENINTAPNENYARELLELFTMGIGNYTEEDIREAARILTGWRINIFKDSGQKMFESYFIGGFFDDKPKKFMGETFEVNYTVNQQNVFTNSIVKLNDVIFAKRSKEIAKYMMTKLYAHYVYSNPEKPDLKIINELSTIFISSGFNLTEPISKLLKSQHFFDEQNIGVQIKSPAELVIGFSNFFPEEDLIKAEHIKELGMHLLNPPNVAGWKGYRSWITTKTLPNAITFLNATLAKQSNILVANWASELGNYDDPKKLSESIVDLFLGKTPSSSRLAKYMATLLGGAPDYEWYQISQNKEQAGLKIKGLIKELIKSPDFYLA
jgi:uncharacterized protein (DUF1800 family)